VSIDTTKTTSLHSEHGPKGQRSSQPRATPWDKRYQKIDRPERAAQLIVPRDEVNRVQRLLCVPLALTSMSGDRTALPFQGDYSGAARTPGVAWGWELRCPFGAEWGVATPTPGGARHGASMTWGWELHCPFGAECGVATPTPGVARHRASMTWGLELHCPFGA
jgi:hypothetical protein